MIIVNSSDTQCAITEINSGVRYEVWVSAVVNSVVTPDRIYESSSEHRFFTVPYGQGQYSLLTRPQTTRVQMESILMEKMHEKLI